MLDMEWNGTTWIRIFQLFWYYSASSSIWRTLEDPPTYKRSFISCMVMCQCWIKKDSQMILRFETGSISKLRSSVSKLTDFLHSHPQIKGSSTTDLVVVEHQIANAIFIIFLKTMNTWACTPSPCSPGFLFGQWEHLRYRNLRPFLCK